MMNGPQDIILKEIEDLKQENKRLKIELEAFKLTQGSTLTIEQYYTKKYLEQYNEILNYRVFQIEKDIENLKTEYDNLSIEVEQINDIAAMNEQYQQEIEKLKKVKEENEIKLNEIKAKYQAVYSQYRSKQDVLKNATLGYYKTILRSMENNEDLSLVMTNVEFVMQQLSEQLYLLILECRALKFQSDALEKVLNETLEAVEKENNLIEKNTKNILEKIKLRTDEEIGAMQESILEEIKQREKLKEELTSTFEIIKEKDIKFILDTINYNRLKELPSVEISSIVETIVSEKCESLKSQDTIKNLKINKQILLAELQKEKEYLDQLNKKYHDLKEQEDKYYKAYLESSRIYDELVEFLDSATLAITENAYYTLATKKYSELKQTEKEIQAQYDIACDNLDNAKKEYDEKLLAGIHGVEIKNLSTLVSELNARKNELSIKLREVRDAIRDFEKDHNNIKLVPVIREKEFVEARLSNIYNSLRDLKVKINRIKKQINDLEISLENYDSICEQIEHLEHELKN